MVERITANFQRFVNQSLFLFKLYFLGLITFFGFRIIFIFSYGNYNELINFKLDFLHSFITGSRFDTIVFTYSFLLLFIITFINLFLKCEYNQTQKIIDKIFIIYPIFTFIVIIFICICDFYYYRYFSTHLNVAVFGLIEDDTKALLKSIWTDYPVIKILIFLIIISIVLHKIIKYLYYNYLKINLNNRTQKFIYFFFYIIMYLMGMRCSFGNVPLEFMEACISPNTFINNIPINGVFALKNAIEEKNKGNIDISEKSFLEKYGYKNINEITEDYFKYILQKPFPEKITNTNNIDSLLMCKTKNNEYLQDNPPNIVFVLTESMSSYFFKIHSENFNLLGSLENELKKCILFKNFVSCRNFTIYTIDGLLINSPLSPISQSKYLNTRFYSALQPFLDKGYDVEFVTGGRLNWRNLDQFFPRQGFNKLEGGSDIKKYVPDAIEEHEWGVYDEFLMKRIIQKLHEKRKKPLFIFAITITNHTPYKTPKNYSPYPIKFNEQNKKLFKSFDKKTINILTSHQYTCNCIGNLINEVSNSALSENTIIVATGDHSSHEIRNHFGFTDKNLMDKNGVPLIFYIPNNYKKDIFVDTSRFGSHKDIFPTLYNLALSNAEYYCVGNDLFSKNNKQDFFGIFEYNIAINKSGCVILDNSNPIFMEWKANSYNDLDYVNSPSSSLIDLYKKLKSYSAFNTIRIIEQIKSKNNLTK